MTVTRKIFEEFKTIARTAAYFATVFILMMVMKKLYLKDYDIEFTGISQALIGALVLSKVVLLMGLISFGSWLQRQPSIVDVSFRTLLYTLGVWVVIFCNTADAWKTRVVEFIFNTSIEQLEHPSIENYS